MSSIESNLKWVQQRIDEAATRSKRDPKDITLIAVSKTFSADAVLEAYDLGLRHFGENRVEEALEKVPRVRSLLINNQTVHASDHEIWHLIGHLQRRKVKAALPLFDYFHSVDSVELAEKMETCAAGVNKRTPILLEVNTSGEESKFGFPIQARQTFFDATRAILSLAHLNVLGLMTVAPMARDANDARPRAAFRALRHLRDEMQALFASGERPLAHLSMGMTDDFEVAVEEGATLIRVGRAIFGERK